MCVCVCVCACVCVCMHACVRIDVNSKDMKNILVIIFFINTIFFYLLILSMQIE